MTSNEKKSITFQLLLNKRYPFALKRDILTYIIFGCWKLVYIMFKMIFFKIGK